MEAIRQYLADNGFDSTGIDDKTCEELYRKVCNRGAEEEEEETKDPEQVVEDLEEMLKELTVVKHTAAVTDEDDDETTTTTMVDTDNRVYVSRRLTHEEWITMAKTNMKPFAVTTIHS